MSLDCIIGKAEKDIDGVPRAKAFLDTDNSPANDLLYLNVGYLTDLLDNSGNIKKPAVVEDVEKIEGYTGTASEAMVKRTSRLYTLFENIKGCRALSHMGIDRDTNGVSPESIQRMPDMREEIYLLGELSSYLVKDSKLAKDHITGLESYFANAYNLVKNKTKGAEFKVIESELKKKNLKPFLDRCKILAEDIRNGAKPENKYSFENKHVSDMMFDFSRKVLTSYIAENKENDFPASEDNVKAEFFYFIKRAGGVLEGTGIPFVNEAVKKFGLVDKEDAVLELEKGNVTPAMEH